MEKPDKKPSVGILRLGYDLLQFLFSKLNKLVDTIVFSKKGSIMISLIASIIICLGANYNQIGIRLFNDSTVDAQIQDVRVETIYDSSKYEVSGVPSTVTVHVSGKAADIQLFRSQGDITVVADLQKYGEGSVVVDLTVKNLPSNLKAEVNPATVTATIDKKVTKTFTLASELIVSSDHKETDYETPTLDASEVSIMGTQDQIDSIRKVKAVIDGSSEEGNFETNATINAYDAQGERVDVVIEPSQVKATVRLKNSE